MGTKRVVREEDEARFGKAVREARVAAGMTQTQLARSLGVTYQQIQNYEKGAVRIAASTLRLISIALDCPIEYFFDPRPGVDRRGNGDARPRPDPPSGV